MTFTNLYSATACTLGAALTLAGCTSIQSASLPFVATQPEVAVHESG